jgi:glycosyltransferase involved in cell wall biosynthesis
VAKLKKVLEKYGINRNYIIAIGTIQPRKNYMRLIESFSKLDPRLHGDDGLKLVIVGKSTGEGREGWKFKETLETPKRLGIEDKIIFTGFADSADLSTLLSGARTFVLPSLWEGFGIPVLEAMACGTPVILSNISSLPEVAGEAGTYFDPYNIEDMAKKIGEVLSDDKLRKKKIELGLKRVQQFSWEQCAQEILSTFKQLT